MPCNSYVAESCASKGLGLSGNSNHWWLRLKRFVDTISGGAEDRLRRMRYRTISQNPIARAAVPPKIPIVAPTIVAVFIALPEALIAAAVVAAVTRVVSIDRRLAVVDIRESPNKVLVGTTAVAVFASSLRLPPSIMD